MAETRMKLKPLSVPTQVFLEMPPIKRSGGFSPTMPIEAIDLDALEDLAWEWLGALFASRGKGNPFKRTPKSLPERVA